MTMLYDEEYLDHAYSNPDGSHCTKRVNFSESNRETGDVQVYHVVTALADLSRAVLAGRFNDQQARLVRCIDEISDLVMKYEGSRNG